MEQQVKILLVDDDREFVESNKALLEAHGYEVFIAFDGRSGFEMASKVRPQLMILDVMMATETEGFEIARMLREEPALREMRIIMLTGITKTMKLPFHLEPDEKWLPVNRILEKPVLPKHMIAEVEKALLTPSTQE